MSEYSEDLAKLGDWPVAILAGGLATRLRPTTETIPKALLEVAGQPFVVHQLRLLRAAGLRRIVFCVGYLGEKIEDFLGDGSAFGLEISYSSDGPTLLGTGGALRHAAGLLGKQFVVLYGDSYLPIDYASVVAAFVASEQPALMTVFRNGGQWDSSNVTFEDGRVRAYHKVRRTPEMQYIDYGVSVLRAEDLASYRGVSTFDLADFYSRAAEEGHLAGYEVKQRFYEIGSREGWAELDQLLRQQPESLIS